MKFICYHNILIFPKPTYPESTCKCQHLCRTNNCVHKKKMFQILYKILQTTNFQGVNIDSDNFIYTIFASITSVCIRVFPTEEGRESPSLASQNLAHSSHLEKSPQQTHPLTNFYSHSPSPPPPHLSPLNNNFQVITQ